MLLAIDMGNTNIELGLLKEEEILLSERIGTDLKKTSSEYAVLIHSLFEINKVDVDEIEGAIIASVVPSLTASLREAVKSVTGKTAIIVGPGVKTGLQMKGLDPKEVGADLVVGAVAAITLYGYPCLIVDMGTATTIMAVDKDRYFLGGSIGPGVMLSLNALANNTSQLPQIALKGPKKVINPGTVEAMQSGIVYGQASMLDGMLNRMEKELGYPVTVVATGGLARMIVPYCEREVILDNSLMLKGLAMIYRKNS